jgi:superfamily II DNA or RNA helicase
MLHLRQYQTELLEKIKQSLNKGNKSICAVLGCGGGKSVIQGTIARNVTQKGKQVLFLVHRRELCEQIHETFEKCGVDFNFCDIAMVQTATRRLKEIKEPALIITDEAHHCLSDSYLRIYNYFPNVIKLGFTATPARMNEGGLGKVFDDLVEGVSTEWLISNKYLADYDYWGAKLVNTNGIKTVRGDFDIVQVNMLMEKKRIYGDTLRTWLDKANGKTTIIYCSSILASKETIEEFKRIGISAEHLDGETPKAKRQKVIAKFRSGEITVLSNVDLFGEGFDIPDCECVVLLRPTKSLTLFIQQSMRSMRYKEGKRAIIIDHVGNQDEHGWPDDDREWSLKAKKIKTKNKIMIRTCPKCFACMEPLNRVCKYCGYEFMDEQRYELEKIDIELELLKKEDRLRFKPYDYYTQLKTFEQMRKFQKEKGYKFAWAIHKCEEMKIPIPDKYDYMREAFM